MSLFNPLTLGFKALNVKAKLMAAGIFLATLGVSNLVTGIVYFNKGKNESALAIKDYEKKRSDLQAQVNDLQGKIDTGAAVKIVTVTNTIERIVEKNGQVIYRDTATRPDSVNGIDNTLPNGAVYSINQAALGLPIDPNLAKDTTPSGIGDKPLISSVSQNYGSCLVTAATLQGLQQWVRDTKKIHDDAKMKNKKRGTD